MHHLLSPPEDLKGSKKDILRFYMYVSVTGIWLLIVYIIVSSAIYSFHLSVVKEFYKIVAIIVEAHGQFKKEQKELEIAQAIPGVCIGMPLYEKVAKPGSKDSSDELELTMQDAKFEVELELEAKTTESKAQSFSKIKMFQWDSESSGSDSYRIDLKQWVDLKRKKKSEKIPRGRRLTEDDDFFGINTRKESENSKVWSSTKKIAQVKENDAIEEESDEDKYGLDFLEDYHKGHNEQRNKTMLDKNTAFTSEGEMVASPVSRISLKKKISVKNVTRRQSFNSSKDIRLRKFTANDDYNPE